FDGMGGTEDRVDVLAVGGSAETQKTRLHYVESLPALLEEYFGDFRHFQINGHARFLRHIFFVEGDGSQHASYRSKQLWRIEWLDDPTGRAGALAIRFLLLARLSREYQHRHELVVHQGPQFADQGNAVHARHMHIG